ncbi:MAG TPA: polyprenyl synthetase family protein [Acidimicrobiales bacterium]|nr:polyprenyl synthetase family protein [Acidimicrobiales bacterium]
MGSSSALAEPDFVRTSRARVEADLLASVQVADAFLTEVSSHLMAAGGKRIRPLFAVASAVAGSTEPQVSDDAVRGGVAVELVHLGSLYHDDVIDEAVTRRTVESVNARWGNLTAILAGDFLLAKASEIAASLGTEVAALLAATIGRLCEGEVGELRSAYDVARTEAAYLHSIKGKTASLFATACRIGALVGGLPRSDVDALTEYGEAYGIAFQIVDDVLDVVASEAELGKPAGHDLVEGVYTLPVLRALDTPGGLRERLGRPLDDRQLLEALSLVRADGAVDAALDTARGYAQHAQQVLAPLGHNPATAWLADATDALFARVEAIRPSAGTTG